MGSPVGPRAASGAGPKNIERSARAAEQSALTTRCHTSCRAVLRASHRCRLQVDGTFVGDREHGDSLAGCRRVAELVGSVITNITFGRRNVSKAFCAWLSRRLRGSSPGSLIVFGRVGAILDSTVNDSPIEAICGDVERPLLEQLGDRSVPTPFRLSLATDGERR